MASIAGKLGAALRHPSVAWQYLAWRARRAVHVEPVVKIPGGGRIATTAKFNDFRGIAVQHPGPSELTTLSELMSPGSTFVDVGANVGQMSVLAWNTGKVARVLAFEPTHAYASAWHRNV